MMTTNKYNIQEISLVNFDCPSFSMLRCNVRQHVVQSLLNYWSDSHSREISCKDSSSLGRINKVELTVGCICPKVQQSGSMLPLHLD
jgi:hypothetical protein